VLSTRRDHLIAGSDRASNQRAAVDQTQQRDAYFFYALIRIDHT
jgi:hypothetical protein